MRSKHKGAAARNTNQRGAFHFSPDAQSAWCIQSSVFVCWIPSSLWTERESERAGGWVIALRKPTRWVEPPTYTHVRARNRGREKHFFFLRFSALSRDNTWIKIAFKTRCTLKITILQKEEKCQNWNSCYISEVQHPWQDRARARAALVSFFTHTFSLPPLLWLIEACNRVQPTLRAQPVNLLVFLSLSPFLSSAIWKQCLTATHHSSTVSQSMDAGVKLLRNKLHLQCLVSNLRWIKRPASLLTLF